MLLSVDSAVREARLRESGLASSGALDTDAVNCSLSFMC